MADFNINQGNLPKLTATLTGDGGAVVDLTGCTVQLIVQGPNTFTVNASIVSPATAGKVEYQMISGQTATPGSYVAQWAVTKDGLTSYYPWPGGYISFDIITALPVTPPSQASLISDFYDPIRAILGDFKSKFRRYQDADIASVVRVNLRCGRVPGFTLHANGQAITPAITNSHVREYALLTFHSAKTLLMPNVGRYSYRNRAMSESFGEQSGFLWELNEALFELENGDMFYSFQNFYSWINSIAGLDVWALMSEMKVDAPVATVTIGVGGIQVNT